MKQRKKALLLIEFQNEFASPGGLLHDGVKSEMNRTGMLKNTVELAAVARSVGAHVFHIPVLSEKDGEHNPNQNLGIMRDVRQICSLRIHGTLTSYKNTKIMHLTHW